MARMLGLSGLPLVYIVYSRKKICWRFPLDPGPTLLSASIRAGEKGTFYGTRLRVGDGSNALAWQGGSAGKDSAGRPRRWPVVEVVVTPYSWIPSATCPKSPSRLASVFGTRVTSYNVTSREPAFCILSKQNSDHRTRLSPKTTAPPATLGRASTRHP